MVRNRIPHWKVSFFFSKLSIKNHIEKKKQGSAKMDIQEVVHNKKGGTFSVHKN